MKQYTPNPIDTSSIKLPDELTALTEELARNVHEVWAQGRITGGWRYGATRDDKLKLHPCLVPYEQLSESERTFDRNTAIETLKMIKALGFDITKKQA